MSFLWVSKFYTDKTKLVIFYLLCFEEDVEFTLATKILNELEDAKNHVGNAPGFYSNPLDKIPQILTDKFPREGFADLNPKQFLLLNVSRL